MAFTMKDDRPVSTGRIETLVDGIFAVAMTILVLDLKAPSPGSRMGRDVFLSFVSELGDPLLNFIISFLLLSLFWIWHHRQFNEIKRSDSFLLGINLMLLAAISMIPFTTSMMSRFLDIWEADMFFHLNILLVGSLMVLNWWYATKNFRLVDKNIDPARVRREMMRGLATPVMALAGMGASLLIKGDSSVVYLLVPFLSRAMLRIPSRHKPS